MPSKVIAHTSPFERLHGQKPNYNFLRVFGCAVWPNLRPYNSRKLEFRSKQCVFIGYSPLHKGYKCLDPKAGRVYISRDVIFDEDVFPFAALHPNAGALLRKEIELLPDMLRNPLSSSGEQICLTSLCFLLLTLMVRRVLLVLSVLQVKIRIKMLHPRWRPAQLSLHISCVPRWGASRASRPIPLERRQFLSSLSRHQLRDLADRKSVV